MSTKIDSSAGEPRTVDEARDAVERSRQRISTTLDQLEDRIVEKKHEIQDRVDVLRPVRDQIRGRPFTALAVAAGMGALLGSLGGGDDDDFDGHRHSRSGRVRGAELSGDDRQELREWRRARRDRLRARLGDGRDDSDHDRDDSRFDALKHQLMGAVTSAVTTAVTKRVRRMAMDNVSTIVDSVTGGGDDRPHSRGEGRETGRDSYR